MKLILQLLFLACTSFGQSGLHIDLSGEWRMGRGDEAAFKQADFDDSGWEKVQLPWAKHPDYGLYWLRHSVTVPAWADRSQLALTLGTVSEVYEVYVNGELIGSTGEFSFAAKQIARPRTFPIPTKVTAAGTALTLALRVWNIRGRGSNTWEIFADGPYLLTYLTDVDPNWAQASIDKRTLRQVPDYIVSAAQLTLALVLLLAWISDRKRNEVLVLSLYLLVETAYSIFAVMVVSLDSHPWNRHLWEVFIVLRLGIFTHLCLRTLSVGSRWMPVVTWLLALFVFGESDTRYRYIFFGPLEVTTFCIILTAWWRLIRTRAGKQDHLLAGLLLCVFLSQTNRRGLILFSTNRIILGRYAWSIHEVTVWVLAFLITLLLLQRLLADRREKLRLAGELEAARVIQQLLLKQPTLRDASLSIEAVYEPAQEVGGDFYYVLDGQVVVIGDVSGKGLKAAMLVSLLVGVLRGISDRRPGAVLAALNRATAGQIEGGFVTCCCARFDAGGVVTIANAGHLSPYLNGAEVALQTGLPLGLDVEAVYEETMLTLMPGESLTFLSDGVVEAADAKGELFGFERTQAISGKQACEIAAAARAWGQNDDITVVTVRRAS